MRYLLACYYCHDGAAVIYHCRDLISVLLAVDCLVDVVGCSGHAYCRHMTSLLRLLQLHNSQFCQQSMPAQLNVFEMLS